MESIATQLAKDLDVPVIGIGASADCDGQVLVTEDMLGLFERTPRFVKRYADLASEIGEAAARYAAEVRSRTFPGSDQTYRPKA
jgi:3-methyl-2-oxobutanoate hydroxymethyltransferase